MIFLSTINVVSHKYMNDKFANTKSNQMYLKKYFVLIV